MPDATEYVDAIDSERLRRAKELSEVKTRMSQISSVCRYGVHSKAVIVFSYAHWEGFYNECVRSYLRFLKSYGLKVSEVSWSMLIGLLQPELQSLRDRNHAHEATIDFTIRLQELIDSDFSGFDHKVVSARSNLDFNKIRNNFRVLGFDCTPLVRWRLRIDKELVGWRHSVAHGNDPDLSLVDIESHVQFTQRLLLVLADLFQSAIDYESSRHH